MTHVCIYIYIYDCSEAIISSTLLLLLLLVTAANKHERTSEETEQLTEINHDSCNQSIRKMSIKQLKINNVM